MKCNMLSFFFSPYSLAGRVLCHPCREGAVSPLQGGCCVTLAGRVLCHPCGEGTVSPLRGGEGAVSPLRGGEGAVSPLWGGEGAVSLCCLLCLLCQCLPCFPLFRKGHPFVAIRVSPPQISFQTVFLLVLQSSTSFFSSCLPISALFFPFFVCLPPLLILLCLEVCHRPSFVHAPPRPSHSASNYFSLWVMFRSNVSASRLTPQYTSNELKEVVSIPNVDDICSRF